MLRRLYVQKMSILISWSLKLAFISYILITLLLLLFYIKKKRQYVTIIAQVRISMGSDQETFENSLFSFGGPLYIFSLKCTQLNYFLSVHVQLPSI